MSLPITRINSESLTVLSQCSLDSQIIAVQTNAKGGPKIVALAKKDVTCWQMFLKIFNSGKLAHMQVRLREVSAFLNKFNWSSAADHDQGHPQYKIYLGAAANLYQNHPEYITYLKAYIVVCELANKGLYWKHDESLFNNVSISTVDKTIDFHQQLGHGTFNRMNVTRPIRWNRMMQVGHVKALLHKQFQNARVLISDTDGLYDPNSTISLDMLKTARIAVLQNIPEVTRTVVVPMHVRPYFPRHPRVHSRLV